jgi:hypothetical protein
VLRGADGGPPDGQGLDGRGAQGHGPEGHGLYGHGPEGHGLYGHGPEGHGLDGHGPDGHGLDGNGLDGHGPGGHRPEAARPEKARPRRMRPGGVRISPALRRLVVTPTFAAGLGVVVAAFLAANMSRTVLHFSAPIPGNQCSAGGCHVREPHSGALASARPGVHITPRVPAGTSPAPGIRSGGTAAATGGGGIPQPTPGSQPPSIRYQQVGQWPGGFADQITISGLSGTGARAWSLAFGYPGARIAGVQGARWEPGSTGAGVAKGVSWPGWGQDQTSPAPVRLIVIVNGRPAPPSGCDIDGEPCTFASPGSLSTP